MNTIYGSDLKRSWFGLWIGLAFVVQAAVVYGVFFRWSDAMAPFVAGLSWASIEQIVPVRGAEVMVRMKAAVLAGLAAAAAGTIYLVLLFIVSARRGERFSGDLKTVLMALIFPVLGLAFIFLVPDVYTKPAGSRIMMFRPDALGLSVLTMFLFAITFFSAMALLGVYGMGQRLFGGRQAQVR